MSRLTNFIKENLPKVLAEDTAQSLGDRSKYIGASDIGSCLRKAYLSKIQKVEYDISQHIVFERGHIAEGIVAKMLRSSKFKLLEQVEIGGKTSSGFDIKAHIDFVVDGKINKKPAYVVIEAKSTSIEVDEPYDSWVLQTQMQLGLLQKQNSEKLIKGYIVALNVNTGWFKTFEVEQNKMIFNIAMDNANILADCLVAKQEPDAEIQLYCSKCAYKNNCPAVTKMTPNELPKDVQAVVDYVAHKSSVEKEIKAAKKQLEEFFEATGMKYAKAGDKTVSYHKNSGKETVDTELLKAMYPDIYEQVKCKGRGYSYIKLT